jgi:hypothetical protein
MGTNAGLGQFWAGSLGPIRITREGQVPTFREVGAVVDIPVDERNLRRQTVGSDLAEAAMTWHGAGQVFDLLTLKHDGDIVPAIRWPRLSETPDVDPFSSSLMVQIAAVPETHEPDTVTVRELTLAPCGRINQHRPGVLFDWEVDAPSGATIAVDGAWVDVDTLAAGESFDVWLLNLHDPAATTTSTEWILESATDGTGTGLATVALSPTNFPTLTATPFWAVVSIDGPWTPGFLRVGIETPADGVSYPMALITKRATDEPPT